LDLPFIRLPPPPDELALILDLRLDGDFESRPIGPADYAPIRRKSFLASSRAFRRHAFLLLSVAPSGLPSGEPVGIGNEFLLPLCSRLPFGLKFVMALKHIACRPKSGTFWLGANMFSVRLKTQTPRGKLQIDLVSRHIGRRHSPR
jgi:hypothetical protein